MSDEDTVRIDKKSLEDAMLKALPTLFPSLVNNSQNSNARVQFYDKYKREAEEYDRDFMKKYDEDLNTTLIFAGLFSAVTAGFIVDVQNNFQPDYSQVSAGLLRAVLHTLDNSTYPAFDINTLEWGGPGRGLVVVQSFLYSSLAATLLAAFLAMLGKQWLNRYDQVDVRGSSIDRSRHRQRKMNGMTTWHFDLVMESLPLMLQMGLLLLGYALSQYLWTINHDIAAIVISFTGFGLLFYVFIVIAATLYYNCPFQTPISLILRLVLKYDQDHRKYLLRALKTTKRAARRTAKSLAAATSYPSRWFHPPQDPTTFPMTRTMTFQEAQSEATPMFNKKEMDWQGYVLDARCIAWMFDVSLDSDITMTIMRFIPEVVWHNGVKVTPSAISLYDRLTDCFDLSKDHPILVTRTRDVAYATGKAFVHYCIQRRCITEDEIEALETLKARHTKLVTSPFDDDHDLESTLRLVDYVLGKGGDIPWADHKYSTAHHCWMSHILLYLAWDRIGRGEDFDPAFHGFIKHSLSFIDPSAPAAVVTDCLLIIGLMLEIPLHVDDLLIPDKSKEQTNTSNRLFSKLEAAFARDTAPTEEVFERTLFILDLVVAWKETAGRYGCYNLFRSIMKSKLPEEMKWRAARLVMSGAFDDGRIPTVTDPTDVLDFLEYHFNLEIGGATGLDPWILYGINAIYPNAGSMDLSQFDLCREPFVTGVCLAFKKHREFKLRRAIFHTMPLVGVQWFVEGKEVMDAVRRQQFCDDWAVSVDFFQHTDRTRGDTLTVLLGMANSSIWRPHIPSAQWRLLEYYGILPDNCAPLRWCLNNTDLLPTMTAYPDALRLWLQILWVNFMDTPVAIQEQAVAVTRDLVRQRHAIVQRFRSALESEQAKAEQKLREHILWPSNPEAVAAYRKLGQLDQVRQKFEEVAGGG